MQCLPVFSLVSTSYPAAVEVQSGGHFDRGVFAAGHGAHGHRDVPIPGRGDVDQIEVHLTEIPPVLGAGDKFPGRAASVFLKDPLGKRHSFGTDVAEGDDVHVLHFRQAFHCAGSAHTQAHDAYPHPLERRGGEPAHIVAGGGGGLGAATDQIPAAEGTRGQGQALDKFTAGHVVGHGNSREAWADFKGWPTGTPGA